MKKPTLVIMAAGMGSRYGGLKQIDPIDEQGHIIMDYSLFDARRAGFERVIFVIKRENEETFREVIGNRVSAFMEVEYAFQELTNLPEGFNVPEGRVKPWGTAHAILSCKELIDGPFAVINADDFYGREAFELLYQFLTTHEDDAKYRYTMVGYHLGKTVTDNGSVARGICTVNAKQELVSVDERTRIEKKDNGIAYTEDDGATWTFLPEDTTVSMNTWGFTKSIMQEIEKGFTEFLQTGMERNPLKCEYYLPSVVSGLLEAERASVTVLKTKEQWYGVTYKEDKPSVMAAIRKLKDDGSYPEQLWG